VAADTVYGVGAVEMALRRAGKGHVLGVTGSHHVHSWGVLPAIAGTAEEAAKDLAPSAWRRLSAGEGTKGPRLHDRAYLELAHLEADEYVAGSTGLWTRGLLVRRHVADGELAYFSAWCPKGTAIETLVGVEGRRWAIEDAFEAAKNELGLDHNETRSWHGWHRHASLVMLAFAVLAVTRHRANVAAEQTPPRVSSGNARSSAGRSRRSAASPRASPSAASARRLSSPGRLGAAPIKPAPDART
jgi:SRSO17 transposase